MGWFEKITYQEAEQIAGKRLDRRRQYYKHTTEGATVDNPYAFNGSSYSPKGIIFTYGEWTEQCSGCSDYIDGHQIYGGCGCHECGYTGKRRNGMHTPIDLE